MIRQNVNDVRRRRYLFSLVQSFRIYHMAVLKAETVSDFSYPFINSVKHRKFRVFFFRRCTLRP